MFDGATMTTQQVRQGRVLLAEPAAGDPAARTPCGRKTRVTKVLDPAFLCLLGDLPVVVLVRTRPETAATAM